MRVRVVRRFQAYWNYGIQTWEPGEELQGELAQHLADNAPAGTVEVTEADPEPDPGPADPSEPEGETEPDAEADGDGPPVDGTAEQLMAWVGTDPDRASQALAAEQAKDKPRSTVAKRLAALIEQ